MKFCGLLCLVGSELCDAAFDLIAIKSEEWRGPRKLLEYEQTGNLNGALAQSTGQSPTIECTLQSARVVVTKLTRGASFRIF